MLLILGGLPGTGKSTIARRLAPGLGNIMIADSVNPIAITRQPWREVATDNAVPYLEIEFIYSDQTQYRHRVENREADISWHILPDWQKVITHEYEIRISASLTIDTSVQTAEEAVDKIIEHIVSRNSYSLASS